MRRASPDAPYRLAVVCLGNICRSPIAEVVLTDRLSRAGLGARVEVVSAGTGAWHVGDGMDERAAELLTRRGYDPSRHRARQFSVDWFDRCDLVLAMDARNHRDLAALGGTEQLRRFRDFDPAPGDGDVPDPYFGAGDGFQEVLTIVERTADALVAALADELTPQQAGQPADRTPGAGG